MPIRDLEYFIKSCTETFEKSYTAIRNAYEKKYGAGSWSKIKVSKDVKDSKAKAEKLPFGSKKKLGPEEHERYTEAKKRLAGALGMPTSGWGLYGRTIVGALKNKDEKKGTEKSMSGIKELEQFVKAGGPYIGPRGGKWADPKHTISWEEGGGQHGSMPGSHPEKGDFGDKFEAGDTIQINGHSLQVDSVKPIEDRAGNREYEAELRTEAGTKLTGRLDDSGDWHPSGQSGEQPRWYHLYTNKTHGGTAPTLRHRTVSKPSSNKEQAGAKEKPLTVNELAAKPLKWLRTRQDTVRDKQRANYEAAVHSEGGIRNPPKHLATEMEQLRAEEDALSAAVDKQQFERKNKKTIESPPEHLTQEGKDKWQELNSSHKQGQVTKQKYNQTKERLTRMYSGSPKADEPPAKTDNPFAQVRHAVEAKDTEAAIKHSNALVEHVAGVTHKRFQDKKMESDLGEWRHAGHLNTAWDNREKAKAETDPEKKAVYEKLAQHHWTEGEKHLPKGWTMPTLKGTRKSMSAIDELANFAKSDKAKDVMRKKLIAFFEANPNPPDSKLHAWAEGQGLEPDDVEEAVYELTTEYSQFLNDGNANKKGVSESEVNPKELQAGVKVEQEHTPNKESAKRIALDHLSEIPDYYTRLKAMEDGAKKSMDGIKELEEFAKAGGPYIGPKGGKWADAKHTIHWEDRQGAGKDSTSPKSHKDLHLEHPVYTKDEKRAKYNRTVGPLSPAVDYKTSGKMLKERLPHWSKEQHGEAAAHWKNEASKMDKEHSKTLDEAAKKTWGRDFQATDYRISGIGSDEFSDEHKDKLRKLAHGSSKAKAAGAAHEAASKMRENSPAKELQVGGANAEARDDKEGSKRETERKREWAAGDKKWETHHEAKSTSVQHALKEMEGWGAIAHDTLAPEMQEKLKTLGLTEKNEHGHTVLSAKGKDLAGRTSAEPTPNKAKKSLEDTDMQKSESLPTGQPTMGGAGAEQGGKVDGVGKVSGSINSSAGEPVGAPKVETKKLSDDDEDVDQQMKPGTKPIEAMKSTTPQGQRDSVAREHAVAVSRLAKGEDDIEVGVGVKPTVRAPKQLEKSVEWNQGADSRVTYSNRADMEATAFLKADDFYTNGSPSVGKQPLLSQQIQCPSCEGLMSKSLSACPTCGQGAVQHRVMPGVVIGGAELSKSERKARLLQPKYEKDLVLPDGYKPESR